MTDLPENPHVRVLGIRLTVLDRNDLLDAIGRLVESRRKAIVASGNVYSFNLACRDAWFRDFLNRADMVRLDGFGLRLGARILGHVTPPRNTWADFGWSLARYCGQHDLKLFFFGGLPGVARAAADKLAAGCAGLQIVGTMHGYIDTAPGSAESGCLIERINASRADILVVGLGMPRQERWIAAHRSRIETPIVMTGGAVFDYLSGRSRRAPRWMLNHGLEWLFRLVTEPRRLWRRFLVGNPVFLARVIRERLTRRP